MPYFIRDGVVITSVQNQIINDATPFAGADIAIIKTKQQATVAHSHFTQSNDTNENTLYTAVAATQEIELEIDLTALTQSIRIKEYVQTDGASYTLISNKLFPDDFDEDVKNILISFNQKNSLYKITVTSSIAEGAARDIPLRVMTIDRS